MIFHSVTLGEHHILWFSIPALSIFLLIVFLQVVSKNTNNHLFKLEVCLNTLFAMQALEEKLMFK